MTESGNKAELILQLALEKSPSARPAYLDVACGMDTNLHLEVKRLLASYHETQDMADASTDVDGPGVAENDPATQSLVTDAKQLDAQTRSIGKDGETGSGSGGRLGRDLNAAGAIGIMVKLVRSLNLC